MSPPFISKIGLGLVGRARCTGALVRGSGKDCAAEVVGRGWKRGRVGGREVRCGCGRGEDGGCGGLLLIEEGGDVVLHSGGPGGRGEAEAGKKRGVDVANEVLGAKKVMGEVPDEGDVCRGVSGRGSLEAWRRMSPGVRVGVRL